MRTDMYEQQMWDAVFPDAAKVGKSLIDDLALRNRAYQVLYALGEDSSTVRTLTSGEAACLVGIVEQLTSAPHTDLDALLVARMSPTMIDYVTGHWEA
jgi:hypothetical protein